MIRGVLRYLAPYHHRAGALYRRLGNPNAREWAEVLRRQHLLFHQGIDCSILPSAKFLDPQYTWIGDRVCLGSCTLICHDGSIEMLQRRYGLKIDRLAPIVIEDDVFVGEGAIVLGGATIGEGSIVGAGSVVRQSVRAGSVVVGNPAKLVASVKDMLRFWEAESIVLPWADLIAQRDGKSDSKMEPELRRLRQQHFFNNLPRRP
jgi:acetyltransferase-like isoleucine patch superfamily enzyme